MAKHAPLSVGREKGRSSKGLSGRPGDGAVQSRRQVLRGGSRAPVYFLLAQATSVFTACTMYVTLAMVLKCGARRGPRGVSERWTGLPCEDTVRDSDSSVGERGRLRHTGGIWEPFGLNEWERETCSSNRRLLEVGLRCDAGERQPRGQRTICFFIP